MSSNASPTKKTEKKEEYQIAISQDGKFAATFDTGKYHSVIFNIALQYVYSKFFFYQISKLSD